MTDDHRARIQAALGSTYTIERELGGGGMSRVFLAREVGLNREVVVKVLPDDVAAGVSLDRFSREIQLAASLQQANIVPLLAAGSADGVPYFTMPFVQGESLRARLRQAPPLTVAECVSILRDVARALSYAHARGVVHRDIKPDNVLLSHGAAVVTDFGIAKAVSAARTMGGGGATLTQAGTSIGTPSYMPPEQIAGDADVGPRADLYSWGCMAYELLAGEPPFVRDSAQRVMAAHLSEAPRALAERRADAPAPLARLVMRCLEKEQGSRPASADEVLREFDAVFTPGEGRSMSAEAPALGRGAGTGGKGSGDARAGSVASAPRRGPMLALGAMVVIALASYTLMRGPAPAPPKPPAAPEVRSVAVLPLANLSGDKSDDYFGIGLAEEMTRALSKSGVRVIGRTSAAALLAKGLDERAVARELGVSSLLTGTVQRASGQIRINVSLLSAADGAVQWTEKYDRPIANVFAVQDEIARAVATRLGSALAPASAAFAARDPSPGAASARTETTDPEAYAGFLQAQVLFNRRSAESLTQAIAILEGVAKRDPKFARGQALLAMAYAISGNYILDDTDRRYARAMAASVRAIAMDSTIAEAYAAIGWVRGAQGRLDEADRALAHALALDSTLATAWGWQGLHAAWRGRFAEGHRLVARAQALEPASLVVRTWDAQVYLYQRNHAAADSVASIVVGLDSTFALAWMAKAEALVGLGRAMEGVAIMQRRVALLPPSPATEYHGFLAYALARAGDTAGARGVTERLRAVSGGKLPPLGSVAAALFEIGDRAAAFEVLERAIALHDPWTPGFVGCARYDNLRKDPKGGALLATVLTR